MAGVIFDERGAKRIVAAVRSVERGGMLRPATPAELGRPGDVRFLGRLLEESAGKWKWEAVYVKGDGTFAAIADANSGTAYTAQCYDVDAKPPAQSVVWLDFWGYADDEAPAYRFHYDVAKAIKVKCLDDYAHAQSYVSVKSLDASNVVTGTAYDVDIVCHTTVDDVFYVIAAGSPKKFHQVGYPKQRSQYMVLQILDGTGLPQAIDWDYPRGHA